jgi:catechol 2,3-dioxygenase-like lactoylglutathione lyase family enzyme
MTAHLRVARPVSDLARSTAMYRDGLGLSVIDSFENHQGFDGVMLGIEDAQYHLELTRARGHAPRPSPTPEDLLVLYLPDAAQWQAACERMLAAGFARVAPFNPYWKARGATFEDHDGYRVVLQNDTWSNVAQG